MHRQYTYKTQMIHGLSTYTSRTLTQTWYFGCKVLKTLSTDEHRINSVLCGRFTDNVRLYHGNITYRPRTIWKSIRANTFEHSKMINATPRPVKSLRVIRHIKTDVAPMIGVSPRMNHGWTAYDKNLSVVHTCFIRSFYVTVTLAF